MVKAASTLNNRIDLAERIESNSYWVWFVWSSAKPVPAVHACW